MTFLRPLCDQNEDVGNSLLGHDGPVFVLKRVRMTREVGGCFTILHPFSGVLCNVNSCTSGAEHMDPFLL